MWQAAYICGIEGVPWEGRVSLDDEVLTVRRTVDDSGKLFVPYSIGPQGPLATLSTCSLRESGTVRVKQGGAAPHLLPLELARGECFRVRTQADLWKRAGLQLDTEQNAQIDRSTEQFIRAACLRSSPSQVSQVATEATFDLFSAGEMLTDCYNRQVLAFRKQNERQLGTLLGASIPAASIDSLLKGDGTGSLYSTAFNTVGLPVGWGEVSSASGKIDFEPFDAIVDWAQRQSMRIVGGPLLNFQSKLVPEWIYLLEGDFQSLIESVESFVDRTVRRYVGRVHLWHATAGLNTAGPIALDEEQVMRLAVAVIHTIRRIDPKTPVLISVDQPWGEYLGHEPEGISPIHFADALIRSNLGVSGIGLELRMNYEGVGSLPRSLLDFSQQLDRWATLGLPLLAQLSIPSAATPDPMAMRDAQVIPLGPQGVSNEMMQSRMAIRWLQTMLAKGVVHGVMWEGWDDRYPHYLPNSGLIDGTGRPRPLLESLRKLRQELLA